MINDISLGIILGMILHANIPVFLAFLNSHIEYNTMERVAEMVAWLMGWPSGVKLNNNLDNFLGQMFLLFTSWWRGINYFIWPHMPTILTVISYSGVFGATMIVALLHDLMTLLFLNIWVFYTISATLYNWQLGVLSSLFHLFRGQKNNVLRKRIDSRDYDVEQLLLGTLLFTLVSLLVPTVMVYYVLFAGFRLYALTIQGNLQLVLALLNHFPLFSLTLCVQNSRRLPGGFTIEICNPKMLTRPKLGFFESLFSKPEQPDEVAAPSNTAVPGIPLSNGGPSSHARVHEAIPEHEEDLGSTNASLRFVLFQKKKRRRKRSSTNKSTDNLVSEGDPDLCEQEEEVPHARFPFILFHSFMFSVPKLTLFSSILKAVSIGNWQAAPSVNLPQVTYLVLKPKTISLSQIFFQYILLGKRLSEHFKPSYIIHCLLVGAPIATVRKLQHPLISYQTPPLPKLWAYLKENFV